MADHQDRHFKPDRKTTLLLLVLVASGLVVSLSYLALSPEKPFLSFSSLPENALVETTLSLDGKTRLLTPEDNGTIPLANADLKDRGYGLTITVRTNDNLYRDIVLRYNAQEDEAVIVADGFSSTDTIRLVSGDNTSNDNVRFDWSGKIELSSTPETNRRMCIETSADIAFCHILPERTGT